MIAPIRALLRFMVLFLGFTLSSLVVALIYLFSRHAGVRSFSHIMQTIRYLIGVRTEVVGNMPNSATFILLNHPGYFDLFYLNTMHPFKLVAAKEFKYFPVLGWLAWSMKTIFIDRKDPDLRHTIRNRCVEAYKDDYGVFVAVEGKTSGSNVVHPVKPGMFKEAVVNQIPVTFMGLYFKEARATYFHDLAPTFVKDAMTDLWNNLKHRRTNVLVAYSEPTVYDSVEQCIKDFYAFLEGHFGKYSDFAILDERFDWRT